MKKLEQEIKAIEQQYNEAIQRLATKYFNEYIKPFCDVKDLDFLAGMGTWVFYTRKGEQYELDPRTKKERELLEILNSDLEGLNGYGLGTIMPEYRFKGRDKGAWPHA